MFDAVDIQREIDRGGSHLSGGGHFEGKEVGSLDRVVKDDMCPGYGDGNPEWLIEKRCRFWLRNARLYEASLKRLREEINQRLRRQYGCDDMCTLCKTTERKLQCHCQQDLVQC